MIRKVLIVVSLIAVSFLFFSQLHAQPCPEIEIKQGAWSGTPLHEAIYSNNVERAERLINPSTINAPDSSGNPPLVYALTPSEELQPIGIVSASKRRALILAENKAREAIASALISRGADVNATGAYGVTPLTKLASGGQTPKAEVRLAAQLLKAGAKIEAQDNFGSTPLLMAAQRHRTELIRLLISAGANPNIKNCYGEAAASHLD